MPMINEIAADSVCILSTVQFAVSQSLKYGMTPVLTFDQPLYWKAMELQDSQSADSAVKKCILRLGGFHMGMSFLGSIGHLMQGSGLSNVFQLIYAELSLPKIMDGKDVSRTTRANIILYGTLVGLILIKQFKIDATNLNSDEELSELPGNLADIQKIVRSLVSGDISISDVQNNDTYKEVRRTIDSYKESKQLSSK